MMQNRKPLSDLSDAELDALIEEQYQVATPFLAFYVEERFRRRSEASGARMERMTVTMKRLSWAVFVLSILSSVASVAAIVGG